MNLAIPTPGVRRRSVTGLWFRHAVSFVRYWKFVLTWVVIEPLIVLVAIAFGVGKLVGEVEAVSYAQYVTPGIIMGNAMFHALFETSWNAYNRIDNDVYETILTTPITVTEITLGDILWAVTRALLTTIATAAFAVAFGWIDPLAAVGILLPAILVGIAFGALGFLFSAVAPHTTFLTLVFTLVASPMFFFAGVFFPISILPDWVEPFAWALPLTSAVHIARGFALAEFNASHVWSLVYLGAATAIMWPAAVYLLKRRLIK